jgi:hypothetical protein
MHNIIIHYIIDGNIIECHLEIDQGEKGEKDEYGMLLTPDIAPSAQLNDVYYYDNNVTFLIDEKTQSEIEEYAILHVKR